MIFDIFTLTGREKERRKWNDHPGREKVMGCPEIVFGNCGRNEKV